MKQLWKALLICCVGCMCFFAGAGPSKAADVWVDRWASEMWISMSWMIR